MRSGTAVGSNWPETGVGLVPRLIANWNDSQAAIVMIETFRQTGAVLESLCRISVEQTPSCEVDRVGHGRETDFECQHVEVDRPVDNCDACVQGLPQAIGWHGQG